jgi:hypothetical protein
MELIKNLSAMDRQKALNDAATIMMNSAKAGFVRKVDPDLKPWPENPKWYSDMKGQTSPLTGPVTKKIQGGRFKGWEFVNTNTTRMANELWKSVDENKAEISYTDKAKQRANITQSGGESVMEIKKGDKTIKFKIKIQPRIHLGISDKASRIPGGSDIEHIENAFLRMVDGALKKNV